MHPRSYQGVSYKDGGPAIAKFLEEATMGKKKPPLGLEEDMEIQEDPHDQMPPGGMPPRGMGGKNPLENIMNEPSMDQDGHEGHEGEEEGEESLAEATQNGPEEYGEDQEMVDEGEVSEEEKEENLRMAEHLKQYGRHGDSILAHISEKEAEILKQMRGGKSSINPNTGLPEYFWGLLAAAGLGALGAFMGHKHASRQNDRSNENYQQQMNWVREQDRIQREHEESRRKERKKEKKERKRHNSMLEEDMQEATRDTAPPSVDKHLFGGAKRLKFGGGGCVAPRRGKDDYAKGGMVKGRGNGRKDDKMVSLPQGGYVVNAHKVADLGGGNTNHGEEILNKTMKRLPPEKGRAPMMKAMISSGEYVIPPRKASKLMKESEGDIEGFLKMLSKKLG